MQSMLTDPSPQSQGHNHAVIGSKPTGPSQPFCFPFFLFLSLFLSPPCISTIYIIPQFHCILHYSFSLCTNNNVIYTYIEIPNIYPYPLPRPSAFFFLESKVMRKPCCDKSDTNKGAWSKQEDQKLIDYIHKHGEGCWRTLPQAAGT